MPLSDDCASGLHDYCNLCSCMCHGVVLEPDECKALYKFLMHEWLSYEDEKLNTAVRKITAYVSLYDKTGKVK